MKDNTKLIKGKCPECGGILEVDKTKDAMICPFCGTPYIVDKAISNYMIGTINVAQGGKANITINNTNTTIKHFRNGLIKHTDIEKTKYSPNGKIIKRETSSVNETKTHSSSKDNEIMGYVIVIIIFIVVCFLVIPFVWGLYDAYTANSTIVNNSTNNIQNDVGNVSDDFTISVQDSDNIIYNVVP